MNGVSQQSEVHNVPEIVAELEPTINNARHSRTRRTGFNERAKIFLSPESINRKMLIPRDFNYLAPMFAIGLLIPAFVNWSVPPVSVTIMTLFASVLAAISSKGRAIEEDENSTLVRQYGAYLAFVGIPMALYGAASGIWFRASEEEARAIIAALLCVSTTAAIVHSTQVRSLLPSVLLCWGFFAMFEASWSSLPLFAFGSMAALLFAWRRAEQENEKRMTELEETRLRVRAEEILQDYEDTGQGWFWETDRRATLTYISAPAAKRIERTADELVGKPLTELFDLADRSVDYERTLKFHLSARSSFLELPVKAAGDGEERWWSVSGRPIYDEFNNFMGFRGSGTDLTEKKRSQDQASRLAKFDSLTSLANRLQMSEELEKILNAPQERNRTCAVFLLDLDRFKQVNDTLGHPAGDALLKQVSQRLERTVGENGRVGRLGGDEFKVILPGRQERQKLALLAQEIIQQLSHPYSIEGNQVTIGASVGISVAPENGETSEDLIRNADLALYAAKDGGRGRFHFYADNLHDQARERLALENDLRQAVANGDLTLHYQAFVNLAENKIVGFESLMRWKHAKHGFVSPEKFISLAEDTGLIEPMGEWALREACAQLAKWPDDIRIAVNVSPVQFANPKLPAIVTSAIAQAQIDPSRLELEITESVFLADDAATDAMFSKLKAIGVRLALDDFGTGYSSLGYLKKAPFDKIKIDKGFIAGATQEGSRNGAIIVSIANLADSLGMDTTAEGIETLDELELVRAAGCSHVQGYIFEQPLDAVAATARLQTGLEAEPCGPKSAREQRHKMFRRVVLDHHDHRYKGVVRNISRKGALITGLWNVPEGTEFKIHLSDDMIIGATSRWSDDDRIGVQFAQPIEIEADGSIPAISGKPPVAMRAAKLKKAG